MGGTAFWVTGRARGALRPASVPRPAPGQVQVQTRYSAVSRGTESLVFHGRVPESEYQRMRAPHQEGAFPWPIKYGYANVGRVIDGDPTLAGQAVFCLYPHQTHYTVNAQAVLPLPEGVPEQRAVLGANMETALNGVWDSGLGAGDAVTVVGAGVIGLLFAYLAGRTPGCDVEIVDVDERKREVARELGVAFATPAQAAADRDLVVHASGHPGGLSTCLELAGQEARVVELSWFGDQTVSLPLGGAFHARRLTLRSSQVGQLPPDRRARWTHRRRLAKALSLLRDPRLDVLFTGESAFDELPQTLAALASPDSLTLCHRIRYQED